MEALFTSEAPVIPDRGPLLRRVLSERWIYLGGGFAWRSGVFLATVAPAR